MLARPNQKASIMNGSSFSKFKNMVFHALNLVLLPREIWIQHTKPLGPTETKATVWMEEKRSIIK
jgi:hypothetical protein